MRDITLLTKDPNAKEVEVVEIDDDRPCVLSSVSAKFFMFEVDGSHTSWQGISLVH